MAVLSNKIIVIYHADCADGFCAAWVFSNWIGDSAPVEYFAARYGSEPPDVKDKHVYILDFSYPRDKLLAMKSVAKHILVLDHHKTAAADLAGLDFCHFSEHQSGAAMTWDYIHSNKDAMLNVKHFYKRPWLIDYTEDRDLWKWILPDSKAVNAVIRSYPYDFRTWDMLDSCSVNSLVAEGQAILRAEKQIIAQHVKNAYKVNFDGHIVFCVNATTLISEIGNELDKGQPFSLSYFETGSQRIYSLRSDDNGLDVSIIAKSFGGGGHKHAAGFTVNIGQAPYEVLDEKK